MVSLRSSVPIAGKDPGYVTIDMGSLAANEPNQAQIIAARNVISSNALNPEDRDTLLEMIGVA